jgi:hypothetical protein
MSATHTVTPVRAVHPIDAICKSCYKLLSDGIDSYTTCLDCGQSRCAGRAACDFE